jgi:hypothetical protein
MAAPINPYASTAGLAQNMTTEQLEGVLHNFNANNDSLSQDDRLHQGIYALEYIKRVQPATAQFNMRTPDGRVVPVTEVEGKNAYDPTRASQASWQALISGKPIPSVGQTPGSPQAPYNQTNAAWNLATTQPGARPASVGYGYAGPTMEYDSNTGLPITDAGPWSAASQIAMGGPGATPFTPAQIFNPRPGPYLASSGGNVPGGHTARQGTPQNVLAKLAMAKPSTDEPWWANIAGLL